MNSRNNIIFVGGIHGVGKTTLCENVSNELSIEHLSSSNLISKLDFERINKDKRVWDIKDNQNILLEAIKLFLEEDKDYLLDGHFCLIDSDNYIREIPETVFEALGILAIIILTNNENIILERLKLRDDNDYSLEFIQVFQEKEIAYGKYVANKIKVPIKVIDISKEEVDIASSIKELLYDWNNKPK